MALLLICISQLSKIVYIKVGESNGRQLVKTFFSEEEKKSGNVFMNDKEICQDF